jgi:hypothetical protein
MPARPRNRLRHWLAGLLVSGLLASAGPAQAEPKAAAPGGEAIKKAQGLIRQLSQEKAALEAEKTAWAGEKATLEAKVKSLDAAVAQLQPLQAEVARYKAGLETVRSNLEAQLGQQRQREQALLQKHNDVVAKARDIRDDNSLLVQAVQEREQWIAQCTDVNQQLRTANQEILQQYQNKGLLQQLAELDPLTGIGQVQTEAVAEAYRYKLQQLKITPFEPGVPNGQGAQNVQDGQGRQTELSTPTAPADGENNALPEAGPAQATEDTGARAGGVSDSVNPSRPQRDANPEAGR